jgi:hypothetical protein
MAQNHLSDGEEEDRLLSSDQAAGAPVRSNQDTSHIAVPAAPPQSALWLQIVLIVLSLLSGAMIVVQTALSVKFAELYACTHTVTRTHWHTADSLPVLVLLFTGSHHTHTTHTHTHTHTRARARMLVLLVVLQKCGFSCVGPHLFRRFTSAASTTTEVWMCACVCTGRVPHRSPTFSNL